MYLPCLSRVNNQGRTKDEPRMNLPTLKLKKVLFIKITILFPSLIPSPILPTDDRETTERTPTQLPVTKRLFLNIAFLKRLTRILKLLTIFLKTFTPFLKRFTPCCAFRAHLLLCFTPNKHKKCTFPQKKVHFSLHTDKF